MSFEDSWKALCDFATDLQKRGVKMPAIVIRDLRSAKTMIQIQKADPTYVENLLRIDTYLRNVESQLFFLAQNKFGSDYVGRWMKKIEKARRKINEKGKKKAISKFVPGLPRGVHWIRIHISEDTPQKEIEELARESGLSYKMQTNNYILIYGNGERIKVFVRRIAKKMKAR